MYNLPVCAKIMKLYTKRILTCLPLKDIAVVLDQDLPGLQEQVTTQGGVLQLAAFGTPDGYQLLCGERAF